MLSYLAVDANKQPTVFTIYMQKVLLHTDTTYAKLFTYLNKFWRKKNYNLKNVCTY